MEIDIFVSTYPIFLGQLALLQAVASPTVASARYRVLAETQRLDTRRMHWWPNKLNLKFLHPQSPLADPHGRERYGSRWPGENQHQIDASGRLPQPAGARRRLNRGAAPALEPSSA